MMMISKHLISGHVIGGESLMNDDDGDDLGGWVKVGVMETFTHKKRISTAIILPKFGITCYGFLVNKRGMFPAILVSHDVLGSSNIYS